jgi:hypothetical protein
LAPACLFEVELCPECGVFLLGPVGFFGRVELLLDEGLVSVFEGAVLLLQVVDRREDLLGGVGFTFALAKVVGVDILALPAAGGLGEVRGVGLGEFGVVGEAEEVFLRGHAASA